MYLFAAVFGTVAGESPQQGAEASGLNEVEQGGEVLFLLARQD